MDFNTFLKMFAQWQSKPHMYIINPQKMKNVYNAYDVLSQITFGASFKVKINEFNIGTVAIVGEIDDFVVQDISQFVSIIKYASNFEIYPLINGKMQFTMMFYDVMKLVK